MKIGLLLFAAFLILKGWSQPEDYSFTRLSTGQGLSSNVVTAIVKDTRGFMWFGTQNGLNRYDGYEFRHYLRNDSLPGSISGNYILSICVDSSGDLWIGTEKNGLNKFNRKKDRFTQFRHDPADPASLSGNTVRALLQTADGVLYAGTNQGLSRFRENPPRFEQVPLIATGRDFTRSEIFYLYPIRGRMWIGTDHELLRYDPVSGQVEIFDIHPSRQSPATDWMVNSLLETSDRRILVATHQGIYQFNPDSNSFMPSFAPEASWQGEIQALVEDRKGNLWIGTFGDGLIRMGEGYSGISVLRYVADDPSSLSSDFVNTLYTDDAGILWVGTYGGGICQLSQVRIQIGHFRQEAGNNNSLAGDEVYAILESGNELWVGTEAGISLYNRESGNWQHLSEVQGTSQAITNQVIYCLEQDASGNIWAGTTSSGLKKIIREEGLSSKVRISDYSPGMDARRSIAGHQVLCLLTDSRNRLWAGTDQGVSLLENGRVIKNYVDLPGNQAGVTSPEVYLVFEDSRKNIWITTTSGLFRHDPASDRFLPAGDTASAGTGPEGKLIYSILEDESGNFWLGTDNAGLLLFDPGTGKTIRRYTREDGLPDHVIYGILRDDEGNLWMSSNNGLFKAIRQPGSDKLTLVVYNSKNWLTTDAFNIGAYFKGKQGHLYFGSNEGLTWFHPGEVKGNTTKPPVVITDFKLFFKAVGISGDGSTPLGESISETGRLVLRHNQNVLSFKFAALNYIEPAKNRYAFMMEGLETNWNYPGSLREAQYLYLPPGEYRFRVRAANNDGIWNNEGASIDILITPPFTQTGWFYLLSAAGLILLIWWLLHLRTRRLRAARDMLEKQVQLRTKELRRTNRNLEEEIQERQKAEEALKKSEARFRQLIETMNEGFSVQDKRGKIIYVNPRLCEMFGYTAQEITGHAPVDFMDDSDPENIRKYHASREEGIKKGVIGSYELRWKRKDGTTFDTVVSPKPIFDPETGYAGSVAVLTDITDLKNAEKELLSKNKALNSALEELKVTQTQLIESEKMASLGQLTAGVAHEINNPINFVSGNVQPLRRDIGEVVALLRKYDELAEKKKLKGEFPEIETMKQELDFEFLLAEIDHLLNGIGEGAHRTSEIVKGLRNFTRMDEHELKYANLNHGLDSTLLILENKLRQRIRVIRDYGDIPEIMCYPGQLNQVFMNILNNASEAIENQGEIRIMTRYLEEGPSVRVSIRDTGTGMDEKVKRRIFEPFFTTKDVGKGTGLGLSISYGIIEKHNGKIEVNSQPGQGTEFIITLPVSQPL